ncbi:MAG: DUF4982 domain-containing protein [Clostridia bacterium]|nr:DUF4982 domain-containing protein [Clostridia bacterium]
MQQWEQEKSFCTESFEGCDKTAIRRCCSLDLGWEFVQKDVEAEDAAWESLSPRVLNLPHDWSIEGEYDQSNPSGGSGGYLPTGIGWYRKALQIPSQWREGRQVSLAFDGVFCNSTVYVDGEQVGGREYGWLSFSCDITEQVQGKESVTVTVKVDNSVQPAARWYTGSGIYSHVWLISTARVHVAENGTYAVATADEKGVPTGDLALKTVIKNSSTEDATVSVRTTVFPRGSAVAVAQVVSPSVTVAAGEECTVTQATKVEKPLLWSFEHPNLYDIKTEIFSEDVALDDYITEFGFRAVRYDVNGFYLNGESIVLKGVANHWALGPMGAAQTTNIIRYKIQLMQNMGVNCIRTAHNACPPEFYRLCNEMGMMVMDEFSEGERGKTAGDYGTRWFKDLWKRDVEYWVKRDRNHPCIVVWSIGNEIGSTNDNTGISEHIKQFDTTRPTTGSMIFTGVDIPGANGISERSTFTQPIETLPLVATEAPHTHAVRGVHRTQTWYRGRFSEEGSGNIIYHLTDSEIFKYDWSSEAVGPRIWPSDYDNATSQMSVRKHWTLTRDNPWRVGEFRWTGFDYMGEANYVLGGWPYRMFHSGAVDTALFGKDMYYLYQSMWLDKPMLHILPSWTHPTMGEGTEIPVWVYSNCEKVELFLNGTSLGMIDRGPMDKRGQYSIQFDWLVPYTPGTITAVGYDKDGKELLRDTCTTASAPVAITLKNTTDEALAVDPFWVGQVTVSTVDKEGNFYPYGENRTYYHVSGPAYIRAADNGCPTDTEAHVNGNRKAFMGLSKVFVGATGESGDVLFTAASVLGEKRQLTSDLVHIDVRQLALRGNPAKDAFEIYYTLDGSVPDRSSARYNGAFEVEAETTVRAAVYVAGGDAPMFLMEEAFGANEGMYWAGTGEFAAEENVFPAKDAAIAGESIGKLDYGYVEQYIDFCGKPGTAEYTVTAKEDGVCYLAVCYNNGSGTVGDFKMLEISVNGTLIENKKIFYNGPWRTFWSYFICKAELKKGENTVRFHSPATAGPNLKQVILLSEDTVYTAKEASQTSDGELVACDPSFDKVCVRADSEEQVSWVVSDKPCGAYRLHFWYSSHKGGLREISGSVNGESVAVWSALPVSPDFGSSLGYCKDEIILPPGINTVSVTAPEGGTLVGAMVLESVKEFPSVSVTVDASCVASARLSVAENAPVLADSEAVSDATVFNMVTTGEGLIYLISKKNGKLLTCDGVAPTLSDCETHGNAQWQRTGEAEHYDYLMHVASGKILAVDNDGTLILDERSNYRDGDMRTNRAYWRFTAAAGEQ